MPFADLRAFVERAEQEGELRRVDGADWNLEIGALTELVAFQPNPPALLFDRIQGYPPAYRVLTNALNNQRRVALGAGACPTMPAASTWCKACARELRGFQPIPPREVEGGPLCENVLSGSDVDLWRFPVPHWHEGDGGRYIGTGCPVHHARPADGLDQRGHLPRAGRTTASGGAVHVAGQARARMREALGARRERAGGGRLRRRPAAADRRRRSSAPGRCRSTTTWAGIAASRWRSMRGAVHRAADSRDGGDRARGRGAAARSTSTTEGPFGEWTGDYASGERAEPIIHVKNVYHRDDPMLHGTPPLRRRVRRRAPTCSRAALVWHALETAGHAGPAGRLPLESGASFLLLVISLKQRYNGPRAPGGDGGERHARGRLHDEVHDRGRRGHRPVEPARRAVGDRHALRPGRRRSTSCGSAGARRSTRGCRRRSAPRATSRRAARSSTRRGRSPGATSSRPSRRSARGSSSRCSTSTRRCCDRASTESGDLVWRSAPRPGRVWGGALVA